MSKNLLQKTERVYSVFTIVTFIVIAPLFYFISETLNLNNADESLILRKFLFTQKSLPNFKESDITNWNKYNFDIKIFPDKGIKKDSLFFSTYFENLDKEYESYRELNSPILIENKPYTFSARINLVASYNLIISTVLLFIALLLLLFVGFYFINKKFSYNLWKPFYNTLHQIENYEIDKNKQLRFDNTDIEEFIRLNKSLNELIKKNTAIYESQHEFVENAAHELQTPIAVFKGKIDMLMQRSDLTKGQSEILETINASIARLNKLNKNLLLLSKIGKSYFDDISNISIRELIEQQLDFFTEQANQKNIKIETKFDENTIVKSNIYLTEILISNLILNAIQHNIPNGKIGISLSGNQLTILNTGYTPAIKVKNIFNRFSKYKSSNKGNGLGLAIVKEITDLNNWAISYSYSNNIHSFSVQF